MNCIVTTKNAVTVAKIIGDLDHHTARFVRNEIDKALREENPKRLILDFSAVTFMDSSGIGLVMGRYKLMSEADGEVIIACTPTYIKKVFRLAGIDRLTKIVNEYDKLLEIDTDDEKTAGLEEEEKNCEESEKVETKAN